MKFIEWITTPMTITAGEGTYILGMFLVGLAFNYNWAMLPVFLGLVFYGKYLHDEEIRTFKKDAIKNYKRSVKPK